MWNYLHQIKVLVDQLTTCGSPVGDEDLILHTLAGLPSLYRLFQTAIRTRSRHDHVSLEELHTLLIYEELSLTKDTTNDSSTAFTARRTVPQPSSLPGCSTTTHNQQHRQSFGSSNRSSRSSGSQPNSNFDTSGHSLRSSSHGGRFTPQKSRPHCQICSKVGHLAIDCFHRMDFTF
ncbi:hypothetical protein MRB53_032805 [Persea americana]|uniref:Uncharacterized protein n=1 Tax=Persea americana TaxID=3435 RepID=A0ACC2KTF0_PERAE|nr:hypothetical protein MRB53_032805 [Persea americana]